MANRDGLDEHDASYIAPHKLAPPVKRIRLRHTREQAPSPSVGDSESSSSEWEPIPPDLIYDVEIDEPQEEDDEQEVEIIVDTHSDPPAKRPLDSSISATDSSNTNRGANIATAGCSSAQGGPQRRSSPYTIALQYPAYRPRYIHRQHKYFATAELPVIPEIPPRMICKARCDEEWHRQQYRRQLAFGRKSKERPRPRLIAITFRPPVIQKKRRTMSPIDGGRPSRYRKSGDRIENALAQQDPDCRHYTDEECCQIVLGWKLNQGPPVGSAPECLRRLTLNDRLKVIYRTTRKFYKYLQETDQYIRDVRTMPKPWLVMKDAVRDCTGVPLFSGQYMFGHGRGKTERWVSRPLRESSNAPTSPSPEDACTRPRQSTYVKFCDKKPSRLPAMSFSNSNAQTGVDYDAVIANYKAELAALDAESEDGMDYESEGSHTLTPALTPSSEEVANSIEGEEDGADQLRQAMALSLTEAHPLGSTNEEMPVSFTAPQDSTQGTSSVSSFRLPPQPFHDSSAPERASKTSTLEPADVLALGVERLQQLGYTLNEIPVLRARYDMWTDNQRPGDKEKFTTAMTEEEEREATLRAIEDSQWRNAE